MKIKAFVPAALAQPLLVVALLAMTGGCAALSGKKNPPDEFAIATKAPLVVPPDYALRPPRPGESRPQEMSASQRAQQVLMGDMRSTPPTPGEQYLLRKANALSSDPNIRALLATETGGRAEKDRSFANQLMFWQFIGGKVDDSAAPLRVDNPEEWFAAREEAIRTVTGDEGRVVIKKDGKVLNLPGVY